MWTLLIDGYSLISLKNEPFEIYFRNVVLYLFKWLPCPVTYVAYAFLQGGLT